jgi:hypothetical protein
MADALAMEKFANFVAQVKHPARRMHINVVHDHLYAALLIVRDVFPQTVKHAENDETLIPVLVAVFQELMAGEVIPE